MAVFEGVWHFISVFKHVKINSCWLNEWTVNSTFSERGPAQAIRFFLTLCPLEIRIPLPGLL